jgi:hypothetical protein
MNDSRSIYLLPGSGGTMNKGLGAELSRRGYTLYGRETVGEFGSLRFDEQISIVADDLQEHFWQSNARVIANSYGAYLFLHAQASMPPFVGRVLLLSPIVGAIDDEHSFRQFVPPRSDKLKQLAADGKLPVPSRIEIHVGEHDWQSLPAEVTKLGNALGIPVSVVPGQGHRLDPAYVSGLLDKWLD